MLSLVLVLSANFAGLGLDLAFSALLLGVRFQRSGLTNVTVMCGVNWDQ